MATQWCEANGLEYLRVDYRGESEEQHFVTLAGLGRAVEENTGRLRVLVLVEPNHRPSSEFLAATKRGMREMKAAGDVRVAFVGITGIGRAVLNGLNLLGVGPGAAAFPSEELALAHLARV